VLDLGSAQLFVFAFSIVAFVFRVFAFAFGVIAFVFSVFAFIFSVFAFVFSICSRRKKRDVDHPERDGDGRMWRFY
jgi:predicted membrane protein